MTDLPQYDANALLGEPTPELLALLAATPPPSGHVLRIANGARTRMLQPYRGGKQRAELHRRFLVGKEMGALTAAKVVPCFPEHYGFAVHSGVEETQPPVQDGACVPGWRNKGGVRRKLVETEVETTAGPTLRALFLQPAAVLGGMRTGSAPERALYARAVRATAGVLLAALAASARLAGFSHGSLSGDAVGFATPQPRGRKRLYEVVATRDASFITGVRHAKSLGQRAVSVTRDARHLPGTETACALLVYALDASLPMFLPSATAATHAHPATMPCDAAPAGYTPYPDAVGWSGSTRALRDRFAMGVLLVEMAMGTHFVQSDDSSDSNVAADIGAYAALVIGEIFVPEHTHTLLKMLLDSEPANTALAEKGIQWMQFVVKESETRRDAALAAVKDVLGDAGLALVAELVDQRGPPEWTWEDCAALPAFLAQDGSTKRDYVQRACDVAGWQSTRSTIPKTVYFSGGVATSPPHATATMTQTPPFLSSSPFTASATPSPSFFAAAATTTPPSSFFGATTSAAPAPTLAYDPMDAAWPSQQQQPMYWQ